MKLLRIVVFSPLAFLRLLLIIVLTGMSAIFWYAWLKLFGFSRRLQHISMGSWARTIILLCGIKIHRNNIPEHNNYILMPNHRSYLDIFIVAGLTPSAMVAKAELGNWPFLRMAMKITGSVLVNRKDSKSMLNTMGKIRSSVDNGIPVTLFPEGTTYKGPLTKSFKKGSFKIAANSGIPIIPMAIEFEDKNDAWVDDDTFVSHFLRQMGKPITHVTVQYGEPLLDSDHEKLRNTIKEQIESMLTRIQNS